MLISETEKSAKLVPISEIFGIIIIIIRERERVPQFHKFNMQVIVEGAGIRPKSDITSLQVQLQLYIFGQIIHVYYRSQCNKTLLCYSSSSFNYMLS